LAVGAKHHYLKCKEPYVGQIN